VDSQLFFYIYVGVAVILMIWFWLGRKNRGDTPTQLNLRNPESKVERPGPVMPSVASKSQPNSKWKPPSVSEEPSEDSAVRKAKPLNILFMYNGHDWDAYAVLGVPAGASLPLVTERFQQLVKQADQGQIEFFDAAYQAILKKL
jgi:hypothetical protein